MTPSDKPKAAARRTPHPPGWQAQKSAATREQLLDAAIDCFITYGYAGTTTSKIAEHARLSRGAMLHHFPSRDLLIQSAVKHISQRRVDSFRSDILAIPADHPERIRAGLNAYWEHLTGPLFTAFHELAVAARTDAELATILVPAIEEFEQSWYATAQEVFPEWQPTGALFDVAMELTQHLMEGMAIAQIHRKDDERTRRVLDWLETELSKMLASAS